MTERNVQHAGNTNHNQNNESGPVDSGAGIDELAERLRNSENIDPDLATIIADNWQKVLGALVCMLITIWVVEEFKSAKTRQLGDASDKFIAIQESFDKISTETSDEKKKELQTIIQQNSKALAANDSFYANMAPLYEARLALDEGNAKRTKELLTGYNVDQLFQATANNTGKSLASNTLAKELAALLYVRAQISAKELEAARTNLLGLSKSATVSTVEALTLLYRISETSEQRQKAVAAAKAARTAKPEYGESLVREFKSLGVNLG